jgi:hypothetical protein
VSDNDARFGEVFEMVRRVVEARGVREAGGPQVDYEEGGLMLSRTALNEYEVRADSRVVFRARHTGALISAHVFEPGGRVEEVRRMDREVRKGGPA